MSTQHKPLHNGSALEQQLKDAKRSGQIYEIKNNEKCHRTIVNSKNNGVVVSYCNKPLWSEFDRMHDGKHFTKKFLHRYSNFDKLIRIFYVVLRFTSLLLSKIKTKAYDIDIVMKTNSYNTLCRPSCYLSYVTVCEMFSQQTHTFDTHSFSGERGMVKERTQEKEMTNNNEKEMTKNKLVITKSNYDLAFYVFLRETQMHVAPDLFLQLKSKYFSTQLPYYRGLIVFADKFGILRLLSLYNERCQIVDWPYVVKKPAQI